MNQHASCHGKGVTANVTVPTARALNVTVDGDGTRLHRLIDDVIYPVRASRAIARRDPMVEALFGAPGKRRAKDKR